MDLRSHLTMASIAALFWGAPAHAENPSMASCLPPSNESDSGEDPCAELLGSISSPTPNIERVIAPRGHRLTSENGAILDYRCSEPSDGAITCDFVSIELSKVTTADLEDTISDLRQNPARLANIAQNYCGTFSSAFAFFARGEIPNEVRNKERFREDMMREEDLYRDISQRADRLCQEPNIVDVEAIARSLAGIEAQTCYSSSERFTHTFTQTSSDTWTATPEAEGPCGIIAKSRFVEVFFGGWDFEAEIEVTNPHPQLAEACRGIERNPQTYRIQPPRVRKDCTYIQ